LKQDFTIRNGALGRLPIFLAVAAKKSFSAAAGELGISASAASQAVARLESELGVVLLVRTTRSVQVTDAGARLVDQTAIAMATARDALVATAEVREPFMGALRLSVPRVAVRCGFRHVLRAFAVSHPEITVDINVDDRLVDIVKDGFDAGVRARESVQKDMVTSPLTGPIRFVVVGAPAYLAAHGRPKHPSDLVNHRCLGWHSLASHTPYRWEFEQRGRDLEVAVSGPLASNDADLLISGAEDGLGLAYVTEYEVERQIASGVLTVVLKEFAIEVPGLFLYYPRAARTIPKIRAFIDSARATLAKTARTATRRM
jgi:DNA-binding transcriptional LysR family regulator